MVLLLSSGATEGMLHQGRGFRIKSAEATLVAAEAAAGVAEETEACPSVCCSPLQLHVWKREEAIWNSLLLPPLLLLW